MSASSVFFFDNQSVCERERKRETDTHRERAWFSSDKERERDRERERVREWFSSDTERERERDLVVIRERA